MWRVYGNHHVKDGRLHGVYDGDCAEIEKSPHDELES